jgi:hypothetical protein
VIGRFRAPAERPLDPAIGRLVVVLGGAVCVGFAVLVGFGPAGPGATDSPRPTARPPHASVPADATSPRRSLGLDRPSRSVKDRPAQDPQDQTGSPAARRADRELAAHRALQHIPYRHGVVSISLVGARGSKAILAVRAASVAAARRAYRAFLRRFGDDGGAYLPRFRARGGHYAR